MWDTRVFQAIHLNGISNQI